MSTISKLEAKEILDSRGNPTVFVSCTLQNGIVGTASVPSGASTGKHEAYELRDNDKNRYGGMGVLRAVENVNIKINKHLQNKDFNQSTLDESLIQLDGTENKSCLGANAILGVSLAFARASAKEQGKELYEYIGGLAHNTFFVLPQPMFNIINGGKHADSGLDIQEFMIGPTGFSSMREKIRAGAEVISSLKSILHKKGHVISVGDEGGFAPKLASNEEALELIEQAIKEAGYSFEEIKIGIDAAASSFFDNGMYRLKISGEEKQIDRSGLISWYKELINTHPIISIEDGLAEDDWEGFSNMMDEVGGKIKVVGDDLTVTNIKRIKTAVTKKAVNSVLIKPNQIGTLSETIEAIEMTRKQGWVPFVSHRSGETIDTFIADLAVGLSCDFIKSGSLIRGERVCKYNRLMEIEDILF